MLDEMEFDNAKVIAQSRVQEMLEEFYQHYHGARDAKIQGQIRGQLGEPEQPNAGNPIIQSGSQIT
jgi:hypothetical protein